MSVLRSALVGSETPRLWTQPLRELTPETSRGFECIEFAEGVLGIELMPWQRWLLIHGLELTEDGRAFRFRTVCVLVARQSGKTTTIQVLSLWRMFVDRAGLVIGTAQNLDVAEEAWMGAVELAQGIPDLQSEIAAVDRTAGKKALRLTSGERYKVQAASRRGGRGLSGDLVVLDELREHQTWDAWGAVTKTTMARDSPQVWGLSNAGDGQSVVLAHLYQQGLKDIEDKNLSGSLALFDWSAEPNCALDDRAEWAQANPALGYRISEDAIRSAMEIDPEHVFRTEVLCQWVDTAPDAVFAPNQWDALTDSTSVMLDPVCFGVDVSLDRSWSAISVAGRRDDGLTHVELVDYRRGTSWVVERVRELVERWSPGAVVVDAGGPAGSLLADFETARVPVVLTSARDVAQACGGFFDAVDGGFIRHLGQSDLSAAALSARRRPLGDAWAWARKSSTDVDISPLVSATLAHWASRSTGAKTEPSVYVI